MLCIPAPKPYMTTNTQAHSNESTVAQTKVRIPDKATIMMRVFKGPSRRSATKAGVTLPGIPMAFITSSKSRDVDVVTWMMSLAKGAIWIGC